MSVHLNVGRTENGQTYTQIFNKENRLTTVSGATSASFVYDGSLS